MRCPQLSQRSTPPVPLWYSPGRHAKQKRDRCDDQKPAPQNVQLPETAELFFPAGQSVHVPLSRVANRPARQSTQCVVFSVEYLPAAHLAQRTLVSFVLMRPPGQSTHSTAPVSLPVCMPFGQYRQSASSLCRFSVG